MREKFKINTVCIFFFLMLVLPASFQEPRGILLVLILFFSLGLNSIYELRYSKVLLLIALINLIFSFLFILNGLIRSAPGAISVSTVYIIWPILYMYFIGYSVKISNLVPILNTIIYGGLGSAALIILFIYTTVIGFPIDITYLLKSQDFTVYWGAGAFELNSMNLATVMYAFVFALTFLLMPSKFKNLGLSKNLIRITFIVCLILIFISARRAFWLLCLISPVIILTLFKLVGINIKLKRFIIPILIFFSITSISIVYLTIDNDRLISEFNSSFEFDNPDADSNYLRKEQYSALINGWKENMFIGNGLGAHAQGSTRDPNATWAYELSYVALLFHTGIVGVIIYTGSVFWIFFESIMICRKNKYYVSYILPQLAAMICFLIANASNPYLGKFDYLWTIFLPIAIINAIKIDKTGDNSIDFINNAV